MLKLYRDLGTRLLDALLPQKTAAAGCAPDCWWQPYDSYSEPNQSAWQECCYNRDCTATCQVTG